MLETNFIVREPVIDPQQKVLGFELSLQGADGSAPRLEHHVELAEFLASQLNRQEKIGRASCRERVSPRV